jgi:Flp pilus assembly CpaF family ATPase
MARTVKLSIYGPAKDELNDLLKQKQIYKKDDMREYKRLCRELSRLFFSGSANGKHRGFRGFHNDIFPLKKHLDDPVVTDVFVIGTGEIIVKKFAAGKVFTGEFVSPSKVRGIILSAAALLDKQINPANGLSKLEAVIPRLTTSG